MLAWRVISKTQAQEAPFGEFFLKLFRMTALIGFQNSLKAGKTTINSKNWLIIVVRKANASQN